MWKSVGSINEKIQSAAWIFIEDENGQIDKQLQKFLNIQWNGKFQN